jgi:hypothetical protein
MISSYFANDIETGKEVDKRCADMMFSERGEESSSIGWPQPGILSHTTLFALGSGVEKEW